jgi:putative ABC transport system permease protein
MNGLFQDARHALRQLRANPGFATVAILTLALGVGLNSVMFRIIDAVILRELTVEKPKQLVLPVVAGPDGSDDSFSYSEFEEIRDHSQSFSGDFAFDTTRFLATVNGHTDYLFGQCVSTNFYSVLGVSPTLGRAFLPQDNQGGEPPVAVISYDYWQKEFAGDPNVLSKTISLKKILFRIVGVTPPSFRGIELGDAVDIWIPMLYWPQVRLADHLSVGIMGRLRPSVTTSQASAELSVIDRQYMTQSVGASRTSVDLANRRILLRSGARGLFDLPDELPHELHILMAVAGFVLLIACANVANLQLARSISRAREIATRLALGASRARLIRHLLMESLVLAIAGGMLGFLSANWATDFLLRFVISGFDPIGLDSSIDVRVLWFSAAIAIISGLLFGLAPALGVVRVNATPTLQAGGRSDTRDRSKKGLSHGLVVMQTALCVALLVGTGLMVRSLKKLSEVNPGFRRDHILLAFLYPTLGGYQGEKELNLYSTLQEQIQAAPGVLSASLSRFRLLSGGGGWQRKVALSGSGLQQGNSISVHCNPVSPEFFATMGISLILGRDFSTGDRANTSRVVIISEALAREAFPNESAVGKQIQFMENGSGFAEVVGIAHDVRWFNLRAPDATASVYVPLAQAPADMLGQAVLEVRTTQQVNVATSNVRRAMQSIDADFPLARMSTQVEQTTESLTGEHTLTTLLSLFSFLAIVLASIGLYGVIAYSTARRTREIGIRVAVGARRWDVLRMIMGQGMRLTLTGVAIGLVAAVAGAQVLASQLFGVAPTDPLTFVGVTVVLMLVAFAACYVPARRASKVDPMAALRYE